MGQPEQHTSVVTRNALLRTCSGCGETPDILVLSERLPHIAAHCPCGAFVCWASAQERTGTVFEKPEGGRKVRSSEFSPAVRYQILSRSNSRCERCGRSAPEVIVQVDHIVPVTEGGRSVFENGVVLCEECNFGKGATDSEIDEFRLWRKVVRP